MFEIIKSEYINIVFLIINFSFIHLIADYIFQTKENALNKSSSIGHLFEHVSIYTCVWLVFFGVNVFFKVLIDKQTINNFHFLHIFYFIVLKFIGHFLIDYFTSPIIKNMFKKEIYYTEIPNTGVFTMMGFDQFLHFVGTLINWFIFSYLLAALHFIKF